MSPTVRTLFAGLVLATCASYGGCWDWSAPDELLSKADGPPSVKLDAAADGPLDAVVDDSDLQRLDLPLPGEASVDTKPAQDAAPSCPSPCSGKTPICEAGVCRACEAHTECTNELCAIDGSCPAASAIRYVNNICGGSPDGSKANPYCFIQDAVNATPHYILVRKGTYGQTSIKSNHELHGEPDAKIVSSACPALTIDGAIVSVAGLTIEGGVSIKGSATATLVANTIGPSVNCVGVESAAGSTVTLQRNYVHENTPGGVYLDAASYTVHNNIIAKNGHMGFNWGGVYLKPKALSTFNNNTVVGNVSKTGGEKDVGGVRCEAAANLVNNILWGNTFNAAKKAVDNRQYNNDCSATYNLEDLPSGATSINNNISGDPEFVVASGAKGYHIKSISPAKNKALKGSAPKVDYDNDQRDTSPDIGADEIVP